MVLPELNFNKLYQSLPNLNKCVCGSDDIAISEKSNYTILKCNKCSREIKRRTYEKAEKAWNRNNPKGGVE